MLDFDLIITFALMGVIFLRQIAIFRVPNKINYTPLLLGVGAIGALLHLLIHPEAEDIMLLVREALIPLFAGLLLFIVMYIVTQAQRRRDSQTQDSMRKTMLLQIDRMNEYIGSLERKIGEMERQEAGVREETKIVFREEIAALRGIEENQKFFMAQFEGVAERQQEFLDRFEAFSKTEMPEFDAVVHRHIEMLRIAEQDHFNQLKKLMQGSFVAKKEVVEELDALVETVERVARSHQEIASGVVENVGTRFENMFGEFMHQLTLLRAQSEAVSTSLSENEQTVDRVREQSELIMKQMVLSAKQMEEVIAKSARLQQSYEPMRELSERIERIRDDYREGLDSLARLSETMHAAQSGVLERINDRTESLIESLSERVERSLDELREHYHIAHKDISRSVQELSSRAKLQRSYIGEQVPFALREERKED